MDLLTAQLLSVAAIFAVFAAGELLIGRFFPAEASNEDDRLDVAVSAMFPVISGLVFAAAKGLCGLVMPGMKDAWSHWSWLQMVLVLLIADDLTQYWWHRLSHTSVMWPLHRAHHSAAYMSVRVVYRNNAFYYALMPGLWFSGVLLYLGFGWVFVWYSVLKLAIIIGAHSALRWDRFLYRYAALRPLAWVVERSVSYPKAHSGSDATPTSIGPGVRPIRNGLITWATI